MITQKQLKKILDYDPETGVFTWKHRPGAGKAWNSRFAGKKAGCNDNGYVRILFSGKQYLAHRLAFLFVYGEFPPEQVDHINGVRSDNRMVNIRRATGTENNRNIKKPKTNISGVVGVSWVVSVQKWRAGIHSGNRYINLGNHVDFFNAVCARKSAERRLGYHINHGQNESVRRNHQDRR